MNNVRLTVTPRSKFGLFCLVTKYSMKKYILILVAVISFPVLAEDPSLLKDGVKGMVSGVIAAGKDTFSGIKEGVDNGRQSGSSIDGAIIIMDKAGLDKYVKVSVLTTKKVADEEYQLTIALRNDTDTPVRLTNLNENNALVLLDKDNFVATLKTVMTPDTSDITIQQHAAIKVRYIFTGVENIPASLRIYGKDVAVPAPVSE
ncbi:hypothetical protein [Yersinia pseudotuberculosis]|uniref:hypothetical protein n=1 Tax=Yersinia pseudotuberculosis TaxID=633 RepID=UPI0005E0F54A|nr:hypothetical protein [Yersinia pseudotuberculosis]CNB81314.1 Uncharacterised protein [Yersinia pseudotuberculosis]